LSEDSDLMLLVQRGDEAALGALINKWELPLKRLLARIVQNSRDSEEIAEAAFVRVWENRARFRQGAEFRPWLFAIGINLARNRLRWWRRRPEVALDAWMESGAGSDRDNGPAALERNERIEAVRSAIAALPLSLREALVLHEYEQLSHAEIAAALNCTSKAVERRIYRAREKLRESLERWLRIESDASAGPGAA